MGYVTFMNILMLKYLAMMLLCGLFEFDDGCDGLELNELSVLFHFYPLCSVK